MSAGVSGVKACTVSVITSLAFMLAFRRSLVDGVTCLGIVFRNALRAAVFRIGWSIHGDDIPGVGCTAAPSPGTVWPLPLPGARNDRRHLDIPSRGLRPVSYTHLTLPTK